MMDTPTILVGTWSDGLFSITGQTVCRNFVAQSVRSLVSHGREGVLAIVGEHSLWRRSAGGEWSVIAESEAALSCCVPVGQVIYVGTEDARILRLEPDGSQEFLSGFEVIEGREHWYAGAAIIDGRLMGPPLGVRSLTATCNGHVLLANVHVGGIPRSIDGGLTWQPTIDIDRDVHQVCAHSTRPNVVIAAAASGLCISRDAGMTWAIEHRGLHSHYCSAVAFGRNDIFVAASSDHFASQGAVYRRPIDSDGPLVPLDGGVLRWIDGIADTGCIATRASMVAVIDRAGCLYASHDDGLVWSRLPEPIATPSGLYIC